MLVFLFNSNFQIKVIKKECGDYAKYQSKKEN